MKLLSSDDLKYDPSNQHHGQFDITDTEFAAFRDLIYQLIGIQLNEQKRMLVISRLSRRLRQLKLNTFSEYLDYLRKSPDKDTELITLINQITTNKTDFFREDHHFKFLVQHFLPDQLHEANRNLRIWSAGCSTGEEPYTIAMVLDDWYRQHPEARARLDLKILATDVDTNVLERARQGLYRTETIAPVAASFRSAYLSHTGTDWQIAPRLQSMISFKRFNLMHEFPFKYGFDLIFCRNVLIYFSQADRVSLVRKFRDSLRPNGYLILGHSESLIAENCGFRSLGNTIYQKT